MSCREKMPLLKIAVWNTAFLGDAVLTLPLLQSLHEEYPTACIDFYVREGLGALFASHSAVHRAIEMPRKQREFRSLPVLRKVLRNEQYDLWICAHTSMRSGIISCLSGATRRIGYKEVVGSSLWFTDSISRCFDTKEEIERLLELLSPLNVTPSSTHPDLYLPETAVQGAREYFSTLKTPVLGLHPGSVWPSKRWPASFFAEIGKKALQQGASVLIFAGRGEEDIAAKTYSDLIDGLTYEETQRVRSLAGKLSLVELAAYLKNLSCYVTNDSGPMHLAWAQHVPVTALFGPTVAKLGFFPRGEQSQVIELDISCRPCGLHGHASCPQGHHKCMNLLLPETVWQDVEKKLFSFPH